jgi:alpha-beta hydrolase superfamily lysophospholipase
MASVIGRAVTADGVGLRTRYWSADQPWASVLIVHGLGEQSGRYEHVGAHLAAAGLDVHAYDHRGMGASEGRRGDVDRWSRLHDDLEERLAAVRASAGDRPVALYAHSVGGLIGAGYLLTERPRPDLVVLSAPALASTLPGWRLGLASLVARIAPTMSFTNDIPPDTLSRDPEVGRRVAADSLNTQTSTARFAAAAIGEQARVRAGAGSTGGPTLVIHGLADHLVPPGASEILADGRGVERRTYPGLRHELHNEPEGPAVLDDVIDWLRSARATLRAQPNTASGERLAR